MPSAPLRKHTRSSDGTEIEYQVVGQRGPWVLLANGLGARTSAWKHQITYLSEEFRFLAWDYRGLLIDEQGKTPPAATIHQHVEDMNAILQAENVQNSVWMGWSYGAQVLLEAMRKNASHPDSLVLINPCYGRKTEEKNRLRRLLPSTMQTLETWPELVTKIIARSVSWPETPSWIKRLGFVASSIDEQTLADAVQDFKNLHAPAYFKALREAATHRIDGMLGSIDVPTLVIVGERDIVTPRAIAEPLARQIPGVEVFSVRGASHFVLLEYPELINLRIEKFFREQEFDVSYI